jgi:hypothetical protein
LSAAGRVRSVSDDEIVHLVERGSRSLAPVCGADGPDIIRTSYRPDVNCWRCLAWALQKDVAALNPDTSPVSPSTP